jgi:hypothetical protein
VRTTLGISIVLCVVSCAGKQQSYDPKQTEYMKNVTLSPPEPSPVIRTPKPSGVSLASSQIESHLPSDLAGEHRAQVIRIMRALPPGRRVNVRWTTDLLGQFVVYENTHQGDCFADLAYAQSDKDIIRANTDEFYCTTTGEAHPFPGPILHPSQTPRTHSH